MKVEKEMATEVLTEPARKVNKGRMDKITMNAAEQELYVYCPEKARNSNSRPGYPEEGEY